MEVDSYNYAGKCALHICSTSRAVHAEDFLAYMLSKGATVDFQDYSGWTPLMDACDANAVECVRVLLDAGADQTLYNNAGDNAISIATLKDNAGSLDLLIQYGEVYLLDSRVWWKCCGDRIGLRSSHQAKAVCHIWSYRHVIAFHHTTRRRHPSNGLLRQEFDAPGRRQQYVEGYKNTREPRRKLDARGPGGKRSRALCPAWALPRGFANAVGASSRPKSSRPQHVARASPRSK